MSCAGTCMSSHLLLEMKLILFRLRINDEAASADGKPNVDVVIADCGKL